MSNADRIRGMGFKVTENDGCWIIENDQLRVNYWVKKGWFSGKGIQDGRGFANLLKQLKKGFQVQDDFYTNNPESYNRIIGMFQQHLGFKIPDNKKELIKAHLKSRFTIILKH